MEVGKVELGEMGMERDFIQGGGHMRQSAHDVWLGCTLETCKILCTNVTPINSIFRKDKKTKE